MPKSRKGKSGSAGSSRRAVSNSKTVKSDRVKAREKKEREQRKATEKRSAAARLGWERHNAASVASITTPAEETLDQRLVANQSTANRRKAVRERLKEQRKLLKPDMTRKEWISAIAKTNIATLNALTPAVSVEPVRWIKTPRGPLAIVKVPLAVSGAKLSSSTQALALFDAASIVGQSNQWPDGLVATASVRIVVKEKPDGRYASGLKFYAATQDWQTDIPSGYFRSLDDIGRGAQEFFKNIQKNNPTAKVIDVQIKYHWLDFTD